MPPLQWCCNICFTVLMILELEGGKKAGMKRKSSLCMIGHKVRFSTGATSYSPSSEKKTSLFWTNGIKGNNIWHFSIVPKQHAMPMHTKIRIHPPWEIIKICQLCNNSQHVREFQAARFDLGAPEDKQHSSSTQETFQLALFRTVIHNHPASVILFPAVNLGRTNLDRIKAFNYRSLKKKKTPQTIS